MTFSIGDRVTVVDPEHPQWDGRTNEIVETLTGGGDGPLYYGIGIDGYLTWFPADKLKPAG